MRKYISVLLSVLGISFAIYWVKISAVRPNSAPPLREPAKSSYNNTLAGSGIIESVGRNITIAPPIAGQVVKILVKENDLVKRGDLLYQIDDREQRAKLITADANIEKAKAAIITAQTEIKVQKAQEMSATANVAQLEALLAEAAEILSSNEKLYKDGVIPYLTYNSSLKARDAAQARLDQAKAQVEQAAALANSAQTRLQEAEANLAALKASREELMVTLARLTVNAPQDGKILQINIREGEVVSSAPQLPPLILGETAVLQVRVDIDEINASKVVPGTAATATLKGDSSKKIVLEFVRIEPFIVPKKSLTGDNTERVDIRVLQLIYRFNPPDFPVYVGQQVDVFIDANSKK